MKKIIYIFSEYFAPFWNIGCLKFTKIAKYLSENSENEIYVFSRKNFKNNDEILESDVLKMRENGVKIFYIDEGVRYYYTNRVLNHLRFWNLKLLGAEKYYYKINQKASRKFVKRGLSLIKNKKLPSPNLIISTYDDWGSHYLANEIKKIYPEVKWIADFRDPIGAHIKEGKYRQLCDEYSLMVSKNADYVTVISDGLKNDIKFSPDTKVSVVTNGFDYSDYEYVKNTLQKNENSCETEKKLKFTYTGSFYSHSLMPFFNAIKELLDEKQIEEKNIEINYAGNANGKVFAEVTKAHLENCYTNYGLLSRIDSIKLQDKSDVLLTAVWNYKNYQGVLGGKVLAYLMLKKPIIGIVMGDLPDSDLKKLMTSMNCGFCYEEADHEKSFPVLKAMILELYNKKMNATPITQNYNEEILELFNLKNIATQYETIYKDLLAF